ncbi:hypothetical protein VTO42DRAFT_8227 [Malbranchea cinnamomea]
MRWCPYKTLEYIKLQPKVTSSLTVFAIVPSWLFGNDTSPEIQRETIYNLRVKALIVAVANMMDLAGWLGEITTLAYRTDLSLRKFD